MHTVTTREDAVAYLLANLSEEGHRYISNCSRGEAMLLNLGFGEAIRHEFGLERGNTELLASIGEEYPFLASSLLILDVWDALQEKTIDNAIAV